MNLSKRFFHPLAQAVKGAFHDANAIGLPLLKVLVPLILAMKALSELGLMPYLAKPLEPLMHLMGLPAELGLAWAASMVINVYSGMAMFASMLPELAPLSTAQVSIFGLIMLYAHSLLLEAKVAEKCGVSPVGQMLIRLGTGIAAGILLHLFCAATGWLSEPARVVFQAETLTPGLAAWALNEAVNLLCIYLIIAVLMLLQRGIDHFSITDLLGKLLGPLLKLLGLSPRAASTIIVGFAMGLLYGSGVIIKASQEGTLNRHDIFGAITLIGLAHAIIEDTALVMLLGGNIVVVLVLRVLFAMLVGAALMQWYKKAMPLQLNEQESPT